MSEEEKKAIEELKSRREYFEFQPEGCNWHLSFDQWETHTIIDVVINYIEKLQKENEEKTTMLMAGADKVKQLEKENTDLKRCIDVQKIMRKDMPKDTKLILMYSEDYKRIFKEE